ncbi:Heavy-metal-associated domain protein [Caulifigura coniformis]|uniref:Heavy-metal-associated domain protein n=1 Tax=Caulifigura coniformis TaxID=2527983 RepID=A0A517S9H1_9PLAN|nr:heavy-metal-associated domain-containing protein [Caulifigura coniformis]QDT52768.1 Heavy-metal-associated domain protein [Caulifigura coniformis]
MTVGLIVGLTGLPSNASDTAKSTVVTVGEMCGGCVKKITTRLEKVPGVAKIECDIPMKTVTVTPAAGKELKATTLWDAMAEISKTPKKMVSPAGTFTTRPKS